MNTSRNTFRRLSGIALVTGLLSLTAIAHAEVVNLTVAADGQLTRTSASDPFLLDTSGQQIRVSYATSPSFVEQRGLFAFDLSLIPAGSTITGVSFNVQRNASQWWVQDGTKSVQFFGYSGNGILSASDAEAGTPITVFSGAINNDGFSNPMQTVSLDPSFVQSALNEGAFASLNLRMPESFDAMAGIQSREDTSAFTVPTLQVTYTSASVAAPEPASFALLALSGLPLGGFVLRRHAHLG